jgi:hypothetical protein
MLTKIRARVTSAHLMAALALFLGLGGTALAVKKNSVGSKQLKNNAVKTAKIAANAVDGSKVKDGSLSGSDINLGSLGKVPSATTADSAGTAGSATTAGDADKFEGRTIQQVRGLADHSGTTTSVALDSVTFLPVVTENIGVPTGGADLLASASVEVVNNTGSQKGAQCVIRDEDSTISTTYTVTLASGFSQVISLDGFVEEPLGTAAGDPEDITVLCQGSGVDGDVSFTNGDLVVQRVPTSTGS